MKKLLFVFISFILSSCGSSSSVTDDHNQTQTEAQIKNLGSLEMNYNFAGEKLLNRRNYLEVIDNSQEYEALITEIKEVKDDNFTLESIDFTKANVLVYFTKYNAKDQLDEYNESITIEDNQSAIIEQHFTGHLKEYEEYCGRAIQLRIYKIDHTLSSITMIHEDEVLQIDMYNSIIDSEDNISNIFTITSGVGNEETIVFKDNSSWQQFLIENNDTELSNTLQNETINFEQDNIFILTQTESYGDVYKMEEIVQQLNNEATITLQYVPVNYMYCDYAPAAIGYTTRVYKVSKEIETMEVNYFSKTIKIDMVNGTQL